MSAWAFVIILSVASSGLTIFNRVKFDNHSRSLHLAEFLLDAICLWAVPGIVAKIMFLLITVANIPWILDPHYGGRVKD